MVEPFKVSAPVLLPAVNMLPAPDASIVLPFEERVVKAAVAGVDAPIAVPLIPVAVTLKLPEVINKLFTPASIDEAASPERASAPALAVKFNAPEVWVKPFEAVRSPAEVIVPVPVVAMVPLVERLPFS